MSIKDASKKTCFVVSPIGDHNSTTRARANEVLEFIIKPATEKCGYQAIRADEMAEPGVITTDMIRHLLDAELVIADLTERNPNVFYEVGVRHAFHKPIILISEEKNIPFDLQGLRHIEFNHTNLTSSADCTKQIENHIRAIEADPSKLANPIAEVAALTALIQSDKPLERMIGEVKSEITRLTFRVGQLSSRLPSSALLTSRVPNNELVINVESSIANLMNKGTPNEADVDDLERHVELLFDAINLGKATRPDSEILDSWKAIIRQKRDELASTDESKHDNAEKNVENE
jgi:hypothetical protein